MTKPRTPKGFRDFLPEEARKRQYVIDTLKSVFESYGFEPLETPALEYEEVLMGKYGEEGDKLMYRFEDRGGRRVAMRYDQTVPLARVVAQYPDLPKPFKRYQIQTVWRAEKPQRGRYREFLQCDADIVGTNSPIADAEVISLVAKSLEKLGFQNFRILINDRKIFDGYPKDVPLVIDKLAKIGEAGVLDELLNRKGVVNTLEEANKLFQAIKNKKMPERLNKVFLNLERLGVINICSYETTVARGLDYYTSTIFEVEVDGYSGGSVCGGGRYDKLIGMFAGKDIPAVGFAFGFDRLIDAMEKLNLFPKSILSPIPKVLVTIFSPELAVQSIKVATHLRNAGVTSELYPDEETKLDKQLKYADKRGINWVVILGPDEEKKGVLLPRNMETGEQEQLTLEELVRKLS